MTVELLFAWMMVLLRATGLILQLPLVAGRPIPIGMRVAMGACLATLLAGVVKMAPPPVQGWALVTAAAGELILGLLLGFVTRFAFAAVEMGGRIMSSEIGLMATPGLGVPEPSREPVATLLTTLAVILFFLLGAHHGVLTAFARSFEMAAAGAAVLPINIDLLVAGTGRVIELGVRIAAPFIAMNFLITLAFSALGRAVPKMNVYIISFSARALIGLGLLGAAGALLGRYLHVEFGQLPWRMLEVLTRK